MKIASYERPRSIEQAYGMVLKGGTAVGGGTWLKLMPKKDCRAIDLSLLGFNEIEQTDEGIEIGSMVTLRQLERNPLLQTYMTGIIPHAIQQIMGVPFRNIATIGGTVVGRYGFSDLITPLLAADAILVFHEHDKLSLASFLDSPYKGKDILIKIILPHSEGEGTFMTLKKTSNDFPILNVSVTCIEGNYRVVVGARPSVASLAFESMALLNNDQETTNKNEIAKMAGVLASAELKFGTNSRGSSAYREAVCKSLVERCVKGVMG